MVEKSHLHMACIRKVMKDLLCGPLCTGRETLAAMASGRVFESLGNTHLVEDQKRERESPANTDTQLDTYTQIDTYTQLAYSSPHTRHVHTARHIHTDRHIHKPRHIHTARHIHATYTQLIAQLAPLSLIIHFYAEHHHQHAPQPSSRLEKALKKR